MKLSDIFTITALTVLTMLVGTAAYAANTAAVTSTVTVQNVSVTVTPGTISWGTLSVSTASSTTPTYTQTLTNAGNVAEDFSINGANATGVIPWTLAGSPASETYALAFCPATCATPPTNYVALTSTPQLPAAYTNVAAAGTKPLDLRIQTPTATADYLSHSVTVTITAVAH